MTTRGVGRGVPHTDGSRIVSGAGFGYGAGFGKGGETREPEAEDFVGGCLGIVGRAIGREEFAGARFAGEFEPRAADLDGRRARD